MVKTEKLMSEDPAQMKHLQLIEDFKEGILIGMSTFYSKAWLQPYSEEKENIWNEHRL